MGDFSKKLLAKLLLVMLVLLLLFAGSVSAEGMVYREESVKLTVQADSLGQGVVDMALALQPGEVFRVELLSAAGTGYSWRLEGEPMLVGASQIADSQPLSADKNLCGGPLRDTYILKAGDELGTETIRFSFARPWEAGKLATKTLAIAVTVRESK